MIFIYITRLGSLSKAAGYKLDDQVGFPFGGRCCFITMSWTAFRLPSCPMSTGVCHPKCKGTSWSMITDHLRLVTVV